MDTFAGFIESLYHRMEILFPSTNDGSFVALSILGMIIALYVSLPAFTFPANIYDMKLKAPCHSHSSGFCILVAIALGYFVYIKQYGTSLFNQYDAAFTSAFVVALFCSIIVFIFASKDKFKHITPLDIAKISNDPPLDTPSDGIKAFLLGKGHKFMIVDIDARAMVIATGLIFLQIVVLSGFRSHILYHRGQLSNAMTLYVSSVSWYIIDALLFEFTQTYSSRRYLEKFGALEIFYSVFYFPFVVSLGMIPLVKSPHKNDISDATAIFLVCIFLMGWILSRGASIQKVLVIYKRGAYDIFHHQLVAPSRLTTSGLWGICRDIDLLGVFLQYIVMMVPASLVAKQLRYRVQAMVAGPLFHALFYLLYYKHRIEQEKAAIYGESWKEYVQRVPKAIIPFIY